MSYYYYYHHYHRHHQFTGESGGSCDALEASLSVGADLSRLSGPALSARSAEEPRESRVTRVSWATDQTCLTEPARTTLRTCTAANQHTEFTNQSRARRPCEPAQQPISTLNSPTNHEPGRPCAPAQQPISTLNSPTNHEPGRPFAPAQQPISTLNNRPITGPD